VKVLSPENRVFGPEVTVSGLLGGREVIEALAGCEGCRMALIPANALSDGRFIDGTGLEELTAALRLRVKPVVAEGRPLVEELRCAEERRYG